MNILDTGGCGFVGSAICRGRVAHLSGCHVTALDNLRRIHAETNREPLAALGVAIIHGDIRLQSVVDALGPFRPGRRGPCLGTEHRGFKGTPPALTRCRR